jgi:hypothetical protein
MIFFPVRSHSIKRPKVDVQSDKAIAVMLRFGLCADCCVVEEVGSAERGIYFVKYVGASTSYMNDSLPQ